MLKIVLRGGKRPPPPPRETYKHEEVKSLMNFYHCTNKAVLFEVYKGGAKYWVDEGKVRV